MAARVFVRKLTAKEQQALRRLIRSGRDATVVRRAQMVHLSSQLPAAIADAEHLHIRDRLETRDVHGPCVILRPNNTDTNLLFRHQPPGSLPGFHLMLQPTEGF